MDAKPDPSDLEDGEVAGDSPNAPEKFDASEGAEWMEITPPTEDEDEDQKGRTDGREGEAYGRWRY